MPVTTIYQATTERLEILDPEGEVDELLMPELGVGELIGMYTLMVRMRKFDEKALILQKQGRMGTFGSLRGQEAAQAGLAVLIEKDDWVIPSFREHGIMMHLGIPMHSIYGYWRGDERGNVFPEGIKCLPVAVPVGSQLVHATGIGLALRLQGSSEVAVGFAGDGATSEGDFHEALNMASVYRSRTLFYIQNNQWAISVPFSRQTAAGSIAQKSHGYGMPGIQVDGNDVLAVYSAARRALDHVRGGNGPYLIEALTFRLENHTTADDWTRYRSQELVEEWRKRDPVDRMRKFLEKRGWWDAKKEASLHEEITVEVDSEVRLMESLPQPAPNELFDSMYENLPWNLVEQRQMLMQEVANG
jgi:pyruvate dehydrogenase E1 component alpha subunit